MIHVENCDANDLKYIVSDGAGTPMVLLVPTFSLSASMRFLKKICRCTLAAGTSDHLKKKKSKTLEKMKRVGKKGKREEEKEEIN